jgi:hypothetical protein
MMSIYRTNKESVDLANQICATLTKAGWILVPTKGEPSILGSLVGLCIIWHVASREATALSLLASLKEEGLIAMPEYRDVTNLDASTSNRVAILVGTKY